MNQPLLFEILLDKKRIEQTTFAELDALPSLSDTEIYNKIKNIYEQISENYLLEAQAIINKGGDDNPATLSVAMLFIYHRLACLDITNPLFFSILALPPLQKISLGISSSKEILKVLHVYDEKNEAVKKMVGIDQSTFKYIISQYLFYKDYGKEKLTPLLDAAKENSIWLSAEHQEFNVTYERYKREHPAAYPTRKMLHQFLQDQTASGQYIATLKSLNHCIQQKVQKTYDEFNQLQFDPVVKQALQAFNLTDANKRCTDAQVLLENSVLIIQSSLENSQALLSNVFNWISNLTKESRDEFRVLSEKTFHLADLRYQPQALSNWYKTNISHNSRVASTLAKISHGLNECDKKEKEVLAAEEAFSASLDELKAKIPKFNVSYSHDPNKSVFSIGMRR